jgi:glycosyltransferase involved in cell wall biosynthesis
MNVSVVMAAYNAAETIIEALRSLSGQTSASWEAIVVDDGSTDSTAAVARKCAKMDHRITVIRQRNVGESGARNAGIRRAQFDWLLFLDADDWIADDHLEKMTGALSADPSLDAVHCGYARVAADGSAVVEQYRPPTGDLFPTLARRAAFPVHACLVRKRLVEEVGMFDTSLKTSPDWDLWQRVARTGAKFGAVPDVLAFYRMSPKGASLDGPQLFRDGLRVLRQGHAADPRVPRPHPDHAHGVADSIVTQEFYLLSWCAGLMLGAGQQPGPLFDLVGDDRFPELHPPATAQCIFDSVPLPSCQASRGWESLWPPLQSRVIDFFTTLEARSTAEGLAPTAVMSLKRMILRTSPLWDLMREELDSLQTLLESERARQRQLGEAHEQALEEQRRLVAEWQARSLQRDQERLAAEQVVEEQRSALAEAERTRQDLEAERDGLQRLADERSRVIGAQAETIGGLERAVAGLQDERTTRAKAHAELQAEHDTLERAQHELRLQLDQRTAERDTLARSEEQLLGDLVLNRWRLRGPVLGAAGLWNASGHRFSVARLRLEGRLARRTRIKVFATVCDVFPIYSQTFVYQELTQLARHGFDVRLMYSKLDSRDLLGKQFQRLWGAKRRLFRDRSVHEKDYAHYVKRWPRQVEALISRLSEASGLSATDLVQHDNVLQAFSFTRMVEAYRPAYLHSYFFYDRSLMTLVAAYLLGIPRGISCYADHLLKDYELKVVPLHLELCDLVIATSERIKRELLSLAPRADASHILVKPNGIDTACFPVMRRHEPTAGAPFRLVTVCRIEPKKGLLDFVEAVKLLRSGGINVEAHIVGTTDDWSQASRDYKSAVDRKISELDLWGKVHLEGRQNLDGVLRFLGIAHVFIAPFVETDTGDKDGVPTALLEGMATGLPAVATDSGSITEVIDDGRNGLVGPQGNSTALAKAIAALLEDPMRREQMGRAAAESVRERYDAECHDRLFHTRVRALLEGRRASRVAGTSA